MNSLNEPPTRRTGFPFHEIADDLEPKPVLIWRNSITIEPAGERPMRQESTSDLSMFD